MGKSGRRNKKKSRSDLLSRNQNMCTNNKSTFFSKLAPIILQLSVMWIIILCSIKLMKSFEMLSTNDKSNESNNYAMSNLDLVDPNNSIDNLLRTNVDISEGPNVHNSLDTKSETKNIDTPKSKKSHSENTNSNNSATIVDGGFQQFITNNSKEYPNLLKITPQLQKLFHPVIKFPVKVVNEETIEEKDDEITATSGEMQSTKSKIITKKVKKQIYKVLDLTTMTGASQLIHPQNQDEYRKKRQKERKNPIQSLLFKFSNNQTAIEKLYSVGKYDENRKMLYSSDLFHDEMNDIDGYDGARTVHMGIDLGGPVGTKVHSFWDGVVHSVGYNSKLGDYGYVIVVQYAIPSFYSLDNFGDKTTKKNSHAFINVWALYGHMDKSVIKKQIGQKVKRGEVIGRLGDVYENGGWKIPHCHFQLSMTSPLTHDMPGAVAIKDRKRALLNYPDPRYVLGPLY